MYLFSMAYLVTELSPCDFVRQPAPPSAPRILAKSRDCFSRSFQFLRSSSRSRPATVGPSPLPPLAAAGNHPPTPWAHSETFIRLSECMSYPVARHGFSASELGEPAGQQLIMIKHSWLHSWSRRTSLNMIKSHDLRT
jgi:hypothetical protein